jgi:CRISPR-associated protein Csm5
MSVYTLTLQVLSPVHIGDGDELRQDFDFVVHNSLTYRLNEDAVLASKAALLRPGAGGHYPPPGRLLTSEADFNQGAYFRYVLRGYPRSAKTDARVKSFIKDVYDHPYIPGSSVKGALRTALAWTGWKEVNPDLNKIGRSKSWAGQGVERQIFGPDPNHDLLRTLHVSDLAGPAQPGANLLLVNAQVLTHKHHASPIELEAVAGEALFTGSLTIDETLFGSMAEGELHFANRKHWLDELMARAQAHSRARIGHLMEWYESADGTEAVARFYRQLANAAVQPNQALLQIGWGSGWDGKTFWTHLQSNPTRFEKLISDFRMHKAGPDSPPRKPGDAFPRSKRAAMVSREGVTRAVAPFGWVLAEITKK